MIVRWVIALSPSEFGFARSRWSCEVVAIVLRNHGIPDPMFGEKVEDLKKIQRRVKKDYVLALDLYDTGVYDALHNVLGER
jgi:hypothetical protein